MNGWLIASHHESVVLGYQPPIDHDLTSPAKWLLSETSLTQPATICLVRDIIKQLLEKQ